MDINMLLVTTIEKFPCIYKSDSVEYLRTCSRKTATEQAWLVVSKETNLSVPECKEKWKNLRYGLLRSLQPTRNGLAKKRYYLHDGMNFVIPYLGTRKEKTVKDIEKLENSHDEGEKDPLQDDTFGMTHVVETYSDDEEPIDKKPEQEKIIQAHVIETISDDEEPISKNIKINETQYSHSEQEKIIQNYVVETYSDDEEPIKKPKINKTQYRPSEQEKIIQTHVVGTYGVDKEPIKENPKINETQYSHSEQEKIIKTRTLEEDPRRMFLLSLLPEIADFSENQMKTLRRRIFGLLDEINDMDPL